ncbi:MAG: TSUP family transporter [bacterium]
MLLIILVGLGALLVSGLTFFSGFGLGTLLLPFFLIVFPPAVAVAAVAVVHLLNNIFKFTLIGGYTVWKVVAVFGLPAVAASYAGARMLDLLQGSPPLAVYSFMGRDAAITPAGLVIGVLIFFFAFFDLLPSLHDLRIGRRLLPLGGALSGFFGGISGHQGAMRATFLVKAGLGREGFIATGIACAILVDVTRLTVYGMTFLTGSYETVATRGNLTMLVVATLSAFLGAFIGRQLLHKTTLRSIRILVGALMLITGVLVSVGIV